MFRISFFVSSYSSSDDVCDGAPQAFKAFIKSECQPNQLTGATKTFTCPGQSKKNQILIFMYYFKSIN